MAARDPLAELLQGLEDEAAAEALAKLVRLARNLEESGLLDVLLALTEPMVVERIVQLAVNPGTMKLLDRLPELARAAAEIAGALEEPVEPATITGVIRSLGDPDVARGLARLVKILGALGRI